ncbi:MAG: DUF1684 domain-containing protein [Actinomycetota bacterium]|nr:DUF1684 domain-containing protein [Actinomycetota bacterium]
MHELVELSHYRAVVAQMYARVRADGAGEEPWARWRVTRDELFRTHPRSPLAGRPDAEPLAFAPYDPSWRLETALEPAQGDEGFEVAHSGDGSTRFRRVGRVVAHRFGEEVGLDLFWLDAYGGGLFLPFRDRSNGDTTYGGGRYLLDGAKGADLGTAGERLVLDFNYAYHPSCAHDGRWSCPLAPPGNHLAVRVDAGELLRSAP